MRVTTPFTASSQEFQAPRDPYAEFAKQKALFEHLRTDVSTPLTKDLSAQPVYAVRDSQFTNAIYAKINTIVGPETSSIEQLFDARTEAIRQYVAEEIVGREPSSNTSFSRKCLALIARCFPNEPEAVVSWGRTYFDTITGASLIHSKDETGAISPSYEMLNSYIYTKNGEPVAVGGFYASELPTGGYGMWGARIAVDPALQGGALFGRLLAHLALSASSTIESSRMHAMEGKTPLDPSLRAFTTRADWNRRVISLYEGLGFQDLGPEYDIEYNGLTEMIMLLPDMTNADLRSRLDAYVTRFGPSQLRR